MLVGCYLHDVCLVCKCLIVNVQFHPALICYIKIASNVAFTVTVKLMQTSSYVAYRSQQQLCLHKLIYRSRARLWLGVPHNVVEDVSDGVDVTHLLSDQRTE